MGTHPGITYAAFQRLESLMATGESRHEAKKAMREASGEDPLVAPSTGKIHSYRSREKYQGVVRRFIVWCKQERGIYRLEIADAQADELVTAWLTERLTEGLKPDTLQGDRAALRMFFQNWTLAEDVVIPPRRWQNITRSRRPALRDTRISRGLAAPLEAFFTACGVRRDEANHLRVEDVQDSQRSAYQLEIEVKPGYGKGGRPRRAPIYPGREQAVLDYVEGFPREAHLFPRGIDSRLNPQAQRRQYAQDFYQLLSGRSLPPTDRQLDPADYDEASAREVSRYLGHNRLDIILRSYLR